MSTPNPATSPWVPLWDLNGGVNLNYRGAYVVATQYIDGDIVILNGVTYMCVRPTLNPPATWPMAPGVTAYSTTLPASPYDGQEAVLVDSLTNPSYTWRFRYNAGSTSAYKWEFVGGSWASVNSDNATISTAVQFPTWTSLGGPAFTVPRAGDYTFNISSVARNDAVGCGAMINAKAGAAIPQDATLIYMLVATSTQYIGLSRMGSVAGMSAGTLLEMVYACHLGGTASWDRRQLHVLPRRVS